MPRAPRIAIDPALVENYVLSLARHGEYAGTGVWRTVYSPEWVAAADQYARWCEEAGLSVRRDAVGNVWGRLEGREGGKAIVSGSHIDTQCPGGRYDGALGALAGLIAIKALKEQFGPPRRPLEAVALCEEESSRFPAAEFWGSRAVVGLVPPELPDQLVAYEGETMSQAMRAIGLDPAAIASARRDDIAAFVELHIEQGPILEKADLPVAVVDAITGIRHYLVELTGESNHAGAFPMDARRDPMAGFAEIAGGLIATAHRMGRPAVTTIGRVQVEPNFPAIVPRKVTFTVDARHPDPLERAALYARHESLMREVAARRGLDIHWEVYMDLPPCPADPALVATFAAAAREQDIAFATMASGAVHDAQQMAAIAPMVMLFVRSKDGRSHTPEEFSSVDDMVAGIRLLAAGLYALAY
ncbi:hydantoinase/carbamoylase family amidase [Ancylobacter sp. VNQ12]|uniref:hydantoinase/carbamoylase family amidase n=1 Tax=Ancylobacter sp. VNQ12 TaxID=3400920 RepID=UPI003C0F6B27